MREIKGVRQLFHRKPELAAVMFGALMFIGLFIPYAFIFSRFVSDEQLYSLMTQAPVLSLLFWLTLLVWGFLQMPGSLSSFLFSSMGTLEQLVAITFVSSLFWSLLVYLLIGFPMRSNARKIVMNKIK
jgi:hypothetical protein